MGCYVPYDPYASETNTITVYNTNGIRLNNVSSVDLDTEGNIVFINTTDGNKLRASDYIIVQELLNVPGVGKLKPGTRVVLEENPYIEYVLRFGWHTNISNQTIYSWYLYPIKQEEIISDKEYMSKPEQRLSVARTVYESDVDQIIAITGIIY